MPAFAALVRAGFRRHATYRRATFASAFTNSVFGFLKTYVLLAAAGNATAAGYDAAELAMFAWAGQGLIGVVQVFQWNELGDRIRTGDIVTDLLRPVDPLLSFLAVDLGRALHALAVRLTVPMLVGSLFFSLRWPERATTWLWLALSVVLATLTSFATRYLINLLAFWWLDARGPGTLWLVGGTLFTGLAIPIPFYPGWAQAVLWCTPFPWMLQAPLDVLLERGSAAEIAGGGLAAGLTLSAAALVQRIAVRRLVVQGG